MNFRLLLKPRFYLRKSREQIKVNQRQNNLKSPINEIKKFAHDFVNQVINYKFKNDIPLQDNIIKKDVNIQDNIMKNDVLVQENITKKETPIEEAIIKKEIFIKKENIVNKEIPKETIKSPEPILRIKEEQLQTPIKKQVPKYVSPISQPLKKITFPYQYGGVKTYSPNDNNLMRDSVGCINDFQNLYGSLMDAVERKDKSWLEANVHKDLVQPFLQTKNIFQLNKNMPINILFNRFDYFKGVNFEKYYLCNHKTFFKYTSDKNQCYHFDIFNRSLKYIGPLNQNEKFHAVTFKVVFLSSRKLSPRKDGIHQKQIEQAHEITFFKELPNQIYQKMYQIVKGPDMVSAFHMMMVDMGYSWKIINFDNYLTDPMK